MVWAAAQVILDGSLDDRWDGSSMSVAHPIEEAVISERAAVPELPNGSPGICHLQLWEGRFAT